MENNHSKKFVVAGKADGERGTRGASPISPGFQAAYFFVGDAPKDEQNWWYFHSLQGVASDGTYWYFTNTGTNGDLGSAPSGTNMMWRVPLTCSLDNESSDWCEPTRRLLNENYPALNNIGCNHFGDLDTYKFNDKTYLVVPVEGCSSSALIAIFRGSDLAHIASFSVLEFQGTQTPWATVDNNGHIYTSSNHSTDHIYEYEIDWSMVAASTSPFYTDVLDYHTHKILNNSGDPIYIPDVDVLQGGDLSTDDSLFYLVRQQGNYDVILYVFKTGPGDWTYVKGSSEDNYPFKYEREWRLHEPEGIDYTDINGKTNGLYSGELHAILLNQDVGLSDYDNVWLKHYTGIIDVDSEDSCDPIRYTLWSKWDGHGAWDGSIPKLKNRMYPMHNGFHLKGTDIQPRNPNTSNGFRRDQRSRR